MACSALGFSSMAIFVKRLAPSIPQFELVFFRSIVNFLVVLALMLAQRERISLSRAGDPALQDPGIRRKTRLLLSFRGVAGFVGVSCLFYSISHLPLPIAMMLGWTSPLFVIFFSHLFLKERLSPLAFLSITVSFVGLMLLLRLDFSEGGFALPIGAVAIGLLGAASSGGAYVAVRAATARVGANLIILYFMGIALVLSLPTLFIDFHLPTPGQLVELIVLGLFATWGQVAMTQGYRFAPAGLVSTMSLLNAAFSAAFGWFLFDERLATVQWLGMAILGAGIASLTWGSKRSE